MALELIFPLQPRNVNTAPRRAPGHYRSFRRRQQEDGPLNRPLADTTTEGLQYLQRRWRTYVPLYLP